MPKRQGRDEFGLNFQAGEDNSVEIQMNFYVLTLIEATANGFVFGDFAVSRDDDLPRYCPFELPSASGKLRLRYCPVTILVEFGKLRRVLHRQRQYRFQAACAWADGETA